MYNTQDFSFSTKCSCTHNPSSFQASMNPGAYFQVLCMFRHGKNLCYILLWLILWLMGSHQITTELGNFSLRLWVHAYGTVYVTNLPLWLLQKPVLRVPTPTSDRMSNGFLWIILGLCLLIESSLVHLPGARISHLCAKCASNGSCCCWKSLHQFARPDAHWLQYTSRFFCLQGHMKNFWKNEVFPVCLRSSCLCLLTKFMGTCSESLSVTAALFFSEMQAKVLRVALQ